MGIVRQRFVREGSRARKRVETLVDSASTECLISSDLAPALSAGIDETPEPMSFDTAKRKDGLTAREWVPLNVCVNGQRHAAVFFVVEGLTEAAVIGATFLQAHQCRIDYTKKRLWVGKCCVRRPYEGRKATAALGLGGS